jgi:hypothetical protein
MLVDQRTVAGEICEGRKAADIVPLGETRLNNFDPDANLSYCIPNLAICIRSTSRGQVLVEYNADLQFNTTI